MAEIYRKRGSAFRYENGYTVRVVECGEALEDGESFRCEPVEGEPLGPVAGVDVEATVAAIEALAPPPLLIERLIVSDGVAEHELAGKRWSERSRRLHLSLAIGRTRVLIDQGDFDLDALRRVAELLPRMRDERTAPSRIRLAPAVTAALLPSLLGIAPPNVQILQSEGGIDGKGQHIAEWDASVPPWPNWYRPSYRGRPVRGPLNLRAVCDVAQVDADLPVALAMLAPIDGLVLRVLVADGKDVYPATVRVTRIDAVGQPERWYPYAAGSFGAEMML